MRVSPSSTSSRRGVLLLALIALLAVALPAGALAAKPAGGPKTIQILNVSDWHGQLDPIGSVGGAAVLSAYFQADRAANPNTLTLTAGDAVGATPPVSGFFEDVPAIKAMRLMGIDADTLGNHNFDSGLSRLQDQINLAGDATGTVAGKPFQFLSANLKNVNDNLTGVNKMKMFNVGGVKVAVIGITNPEAPGLVFPGSFGTIEITDPAAAANRQREIARRAGADVVVALIHAGITGTDGTGNGVGPLVDFANAVTGYDLILGDHTDLQYQARINGALVTENKSKGVTYSKVSITVENGAVSSSVQFVSPLTNAVTPDPAIVAMIQPYRVELAKLFDGKIAVANGRFPRGGSPSVERSGESALGDLVADALRAKYGTDLALYNGGSIRQSLPSSYVPLDTTLDRTDPAPYDIVVGDIYAVLPFGNSAVTRSITGAQLWAALENGVSQINALTCNGADGRFPQISGFRFSFYCNAPVGSRVQSVTLNNGTPIPNSAASTYTFVTSNFVNAGGDSYTMFADGQGVTRDQDAAVLLDYVKGLGTISPTLDGRISKSLIP